MVKDAQDAARALDDLAERRRIDPSDMLSRIERLPDYCEESWKQAQSLQLPYVSGDIDEIVVLGMGGSAIAGDILRTLTERGGRKPVRVVRGYDFPRDIGRRSLAVACSHSGNTSETLSLVGQALERGLPLAVVTTGGELAAIADRNSFPKFTYTFDGEPRCALGHQLMALLKIADLLGLLDDQGASVREAIVVMREQRRHLGAETPFTGNAAKLQASRLIGRLPITFGAEPLVEAAHRWRTQFNENSKCWAFSDELPELAHNTIVGFGLPSPLLSSLHAIFLRSPGLDRHLLRALSATGDELDLVGVSYDTVDAQGTSTLAQVMTAIYLGDFVSYYLALLNGTDPSPVPPITRLKEKLAGA